MKFRILYTSMILFFSVGMLFNFSSGPANASMLDRTGSPIQGGQNCTQCHGGNNFDADMVIKLMDGNDEVAGYEPGKTYNLVFDISNGSGSPSGYGLQAIALDDSDNNVGDFINTPVNTRITDLAGFKYFEHSRLISGNSISVEWTAPATGTGAVTIFASGMAANGNGGNSGDGVATKSVTLTEGLSSTNRLHQVDFEMSLLKNPVSDQLPIRIESPSGKNLNINILDLNGRVMLQTQQRVAQGENIFNVEISNLNKGIYFLQIADNERFVTKKLLKL